MSYYGAMVPSYGGAMTPSYGSVSIPQMTMPMVQYSAPAPQQIVTYAPPQNPFKEVKPKYSGQIGKANAKRSPLRPDNDKLDRLVAVCAEKIAQGLNAIEALATETAKMRGELEESHTGGDPELRILIKKANKEIHRLRTLLVLEPGAVEDEEAEEPAAEEEVAEEEEPPAAGEEEYDAAEKEVPEDF